MMHSEMCTMFGTAVIMKYEVLDQLGRRSKPCGTMIFCEKFFAESCRGGTPWPPFVTNSDSSLHSIKILPAFRRASECINVRRAAVARLLGGLVGDARKPSLMVGLVPRYAGEAHSFPSHIEENIRGASQVHEGWPRSATPTEKLKGHHLCRSLACDLDHIEQV